MLRKIHASLPNQAEIMKIIGFINMEHVYFKDARDACILSLLYYSGLKTHELGELNLDSYSFETNTLKTVYKTRELNVLEKDILKRYLSLRKDSHKPFFISVHNYNLINSGRYDEIKNLRLTDRSIQRSVKRVLQLFKINSNITPKDFRHLLGIRLASLGASHKTLDEEMSKVGLWVKINYRSLGKKQKISHHKAV